MSKKKPLKRTAASKKTTGHRPTHNDFRQGGVISIFLGSFESEEELDEYLSETFPIDFGFEINPKDAPEAHVSSDLMFIEDLLQGFSMSEEFATTVARALAKAGWHSSEAAVVFYNFSYNPKAYNLYNAWGELTFMGTYLLKEKIWTPFL